MELHEKELDAVSGGAQIVEIKDEKGFFLIPDDVPHFSTKEDAEAALKLVSKWEEQKFKGKPPFMYPHMPHQHPHGPHPWKKPMFDIKNMPEELQKDFPPNNESPEKQ